MNAEGRTTSQPSTSTLLNGKDSSEKITVDIPKVVIDDPEESSGFASSVVQVLSMQKFYTKSVRKSRESWLQKYTYHRANEEREWRRPLMRKSPSHSPQPESPASEKNIAGMCSLLEEQDSSEDIVDYQRSCCMALVLEPSGLVYFIWLVVVSLGVMYHYYVVIMFIAFPSMYTENTKVCFGIDYAFDSIFVLDILIQFRTGFLQDGILECRSKELAKNYVKSLGFLLDVVTIIPFDLLYLVIGLYPILRVNRLFKAHRFFLCCDRGEIYSGRPKLFNLLKLILYLLLIIHWVACFYFILSRFEGFGQDDWIHPKLEGPWAEVGMQYLYSLHRSSVIMTTVGTITVPRTNLTLIFGCVTYLCSVIIFATIVGNAGDMIVDMRRSREHYLRKLNGMKAYVTAHQLSVHLKKRVIQWFDYMWTHKRDMDEDQLFANLNNNFRTEIAIHVNLETLIKVEMFKVCDPGFLHDLLLKLQPMICSPGDFICRQGEKGREMYIVNKGCVEVLNEKQNILATLKAGSHFGEISLLNMKGIGDRRTASVRSVGFTDLFRLSKDDLEEVLEFYPDEKSHMENIATKTYERQQKERMEHMEHDELNIDDTRIPKDPRKWLAADTATLRRRLSWIEAVNSLKRFASRVKKCQYQEDQQSSKDILKEYSEKGRKQRSDDESRRILQDFVAEIYARDATQASKPSIVSEDSFFMKSPCERIISRHMNESLIEYRNKSKRNSYSVAEDTAQGGLSVASCSTIFRPRANTMQPRTRDVLDFQSLETPSPNPTAKYGSFNMRVKPSPGILKLKKCVFSESYYEPPNMKERKQSSSFVVKQPLVSMQFQDMVRTTMEKRRLWFEGEKTRSDNKKQSDDHLDTETDQTEDESLTCTCEDDQDSPPDTSLTCTCEAVLGSPPSTCSDAASPNTQTNSLGSPPPVWERQDKDSQRFQRPIHSKDGTDDNAKQVARCDFVIPERKDTTTENNSQMKEIEANAAVNDGYSTDTQVAVKQNDENSSLDAIGSAQESEAMVNSLHEDVECACSKGSAPKVPQPQENDADKKSEVENETNLQASRDDEDEDFKQQNVEETYC